ncbi:DegV family protein [Atopobiaceae bacterium LCP21S3_F11]
MTQDAALKRGSFAIVADSGCDLPLAWFEQNGVGLVPFHISLDGRDFLDCVEVAPADLYVALASSASAGSTSQPSPGEWSRAYEEAIERGYDQIVSVHVSAALSGSISTARMAARDIRHRTDRDLRIELLDSRTASAATGLVVEDLVRSRDAGLTLDEAIEHANLVIENAEMYFVPAEGVVMHWDGRGPEGIRGLFDRIAAHLAASRDLMWVDGRGETLRFSSSTDVNDLAANLARKMSLTAHELGDLVYVEVCAGMPRFLTLIEKPLDTNEFVSRRIRIADAGGATVCRAGLGATGVAFMPASLLEVARPTDIRQD